MRIGTLRNDHGSAFIELALVLPILTLVLVGAAELGRMAYFAIEVSDAARAGVAYGAQGPSTEIDSPGMVAAAKQSAADVPSLTATATDPCVCETITSSTGTVTTTPILSSCAGQGSLVQAACSTAPAGQTDIVVRYVQVSTSATVNTMFHYPGIPTSFTLNGFAKMRVLQ
jgi:Flp pilus assembly protein TadG